MRDLVIAAALAAVTAAAVAAETASQCLIEPYQRIELKSPVTAQIAAVHVERGSFIRKGQALVTLDAETEQAALAIANYRSVMQGQVKSAEARVFNSKEKLKRREELRQENFISAQDRDDAAAEARIAEADLLEAKDNSELARLEARRLTAVVNRYTLPSPISGVVTDRLQNPGEMAQTGDTAQAIMKLAQIDPLRVDVVLPVARFGVTKVGSVVDIKPEAPFGGIYKATVRIVDKIMDSASGTFRVRLELPNPKGDVPAGVKCTASF